MPDIRDRDSFSLPNLPQSGHVTGAVQANDSAIAWFERVLNTTFRDQILVQNAPFPLCRELFFLEIILCLVLYNCFDSFLQLLHVSEEIQKTNEPIDYFIEESYGSSMPLDRINYFSIKTHSNIIGKHLFKTFLLPLDLSLILYVPDRSIVESFYLDVPHVIISDCRIHPLSYQCSKAFKIIRRDLDWSGAPAYTATEIVACSNRNDPDYYLRQINPYRQQLRQHPWDSPISTANHDPAVNVCISIETQYKLKPTLPRLVAEEVEEEEMCLFATLIFDRNLVASKFQIVGSVSISTLGVDKQHEMHLF